MPRGGPKRRLTTVLAADVAEFCRLTSDNEEATLSDLRSVRADLIGPLIQRDRGRIANTAGDSLLVEFPSVRDAVNCAIDIQKKMTDWNGSRDERRRINLRIGINVGDVWQEGADLLGDAVNVAARLEALALPGGICLSKGALDQISDRNGLSLEDLGKLRVKSVDRPVHAFRLYWGQPYPAQVLPQQVLRRRRLQLGLAAALVGVIGMLWLAFQAGSTWISSGEQVRSEGPPALVVLPFSNLGDNPDQRYFSDGFTDDLITNLSKLSDLRVIARSSAFQYRDVPHDPRTMRAELGVDYTLEGSVQREGETIRINARLNDANTGDQLWAQSYDRQISSLFAVQDEVTGQIVSAMRISLSSEELTNLSFTRTQNVEAYDLLLRARQEHARFSRAGNAAAAHLLHGALALDPDFALAHAYLAWARSRDFLFDWDGNPALALQDAESHAEQAVTLDPKSSIAWFVLGLTRLYQNRHTEAVVAAETAISLRPGDADGYAMLAYILNFSGRPELAPAEIGRALELNPATPYLYTFILGQSAFLRDELEKADDYFAAALAANPEDVQAQIWAAANYAAQGLHDDAAWTVEALLTLEPSQNLSSLAARLPIKDPSDKDRLLNMLRSAGMPE